MFVNYALTTKRNEYLATRTQLAGRLYPGSSLSILDTYPDHVCYQSVLRLNSVYFLNPFEVRPEWLDRVNKKFVQSLENKKLPIKLSLGPFDTMFLREFGGKNGVMREELEREYACSVEADFEQRMITAWPNSKGESQELEKKIKSGMEEIRQNAERKLEEIKIAESTSIMLGTGAEVINLLFNDEYCSVVMRGLASRESVEKLRSRLSAKSLRIFKVLRDQSNSSGQFVIHATFSNPDCAKSVKDQYDNEIFDASRIRCTQSGALKSTSFKDVMGTLRLSIGLGKSTGQGYICVGDQPTAEIIKTHLKNSWPNAKIKILDKKKDFIMISLNELSKKITEVDIKNLLISKAGIKPQSVLIKREESPESQKLKSCRLDEYFNNWIRMIHTISMFKYTVTEFRHEKKSIIGVQVTYDSPEHVLRVYSGMPNHLTAIRDLPESFQYELEYSGTYSFHKALYDTFKDNIDQVTSRFERDLDVIRIEKQEKEDERKQKKVVFRIKTSNLEKVRLIQRELEKTIAFDIYTGPERYRLFSVYARNEMEKISQEVAYLHWEERTGIVRVYGDQVKRQRGQQALNELCARLSCVKQQDIELNSIGVR